MSNKLEPENDVSEPKGNGKRKLLMLAVPVLFLAAGAGGWFSGVIPKLMQSKQQTEAKNVAAEAAQVRSPVFVEVPEIVANLNTGVRRAAFIKLKAKLELARPEDQPIIQAAMPKILDLFQTYLREMRPEEMRNSASTYRLREELVARSNIAGYPGKIVSVLFTEMLVQ